MEDMITVGIRIEYITTEQIRTVEAKIASNRAELRSGLKHLEKTARTSCDPGQILLSRVSSVKTTRAGNKSHPETRPRPVQVKDLVAAVINQQASPSSGTVAPTDRLKVKNCPPPPTNDIDCKPNVFSRRLFNATSPAEDQNHPDDLLNDIPFHDKAIAELNDNSPRRPPYRDLPLILIAALTGPVAGSTQPEWRSMLLNHLKTPSAIEPLSNLQDLYLWLGRVGIPNAVIDNRRFLLHFYLQNPIASPRTPLRYDNQEPPASYIPLANITRASPPSRIPNHSVFRDYPMPNGSRFVQWLRNLIHIPGGRQMPTQMQHQQSKLDGYLAEDETEIRQVEAGALLERTGWLLSIYWWLWIRNRKLAELQEGGWEVMDEHLV
jgi:hypothetical protein